MTDEPEEGDRYFDVSGRPVKLIRTPDGGMDIVVFDWETGGLVRNLDYLARVILPGTDTDELTAEEFDALMVETRTRRGLPEP